MVENQTETLEDRDLPMDDEWDFEPESSTMAHWYRTEVPVSELVKAVDSFSEEEYAEEVPEHKRAYGITIRAVNADEGEWDVSFNYPNPRRGGMGDVNTQLSKRSISLDEAVAHVRDIFSKKSGN